jgi:DNA repair protein RAD50
MKAQKQIQDAEASISATDMVSIELTSLRADKEEKQARLKRSEKDKGKASYESRLVEMASQASKLEEKREILSSELQVISSHSESRAKLDLKRGELRRKRLEFSAT